jgi:CDP-diacylglycerol---glycerol-3-phosphate 3-phosphatidyltransferase
MLPSGEGQALSIYALKPRFQALLRPLVGTLYRAGVTANQVTVAACAVSVLLGAWLLWNPGSRAAFALVPLWLFLRMALNAIDGMLAREFGQASRLGAYLNELGDVIADSALYLPFAMLPGSSPWLVWTLVALAIVSEMAGVLGRERRYDGPMGKSDRAFVFGALGLLVALGVPTAAAFDWLWGAVIVLLVVTIVNRVRRGCAA